MLTGISLASTTIGLQYFLTELCN